MRLLAGKRIAVTRPDDGVGGLADQLRACGAVVLETPLIRLAVPADPTPLNQAAAELSRYDWVVFTSANAVRSLRRALVHSAQKPNRVAVVGPATAHEVTTQFGWAIDVLPDRFAGSALTAAMQQVAPLAGRRVLWPRAAMARDTLRDDLKRAGAVVDDPVAYQTVMVPEMAVELAAQVSAGAVDVITFTSPLAVQCYAPHAVTADVIVGVIGTTTAEAARIAGLPVHVQAGEHTLPALVDALARYVAASTGESGLDRMRSL